MSILSPIFCPTVKGSIKGVRVANALPVGTGSENFRGPVNFCNVKFNDSHYVLNHAHIINIPFVLSQISMCRLPVHDPHTSPQTAVLCEHQIW